MDMRGEWRMAHVMPTFDTYSLVASLLTRRTCFHISKEAGGDLPRLLPRVIVTDV